MASKIPVYQDFIVNGQILSSRDDKFKVRHATIQGRLATKTGTNVISQANARKLLNDSTLTIDTTNTIMTQYYYGKTDGGIFFGGIEWEEPTFYNLEGYEIPFNRTGTDDLGNDLSNFSVIEIVNHNYDNSQTSWDYWKTRPHMLYIVPKFNLASTLSSAPSIYFAYSDGSTSWVTAYKSISTLVKYGACDGSLTNCSSFNRESNGGSINAQVTEATLLTGLATINDIKSGLDSGSTLYTILDNLTNNISDNANNKFYARLFENGYGLGLHVSNIKEGKQLAALWNHYGGTGMSATLKQASYDLTWYSGISYYNTLTICGTSTENESTFDENGFNGNGDSSTNKGGGDYDDTQNHIDFPTLPSNNVLNSTITSGEIGLHIYKLNSNLTSFLSNLQSDWTNYYKNIVSINLTKFPISSTSSQPCVVGGVTHGSNSYDMLTNQYATINFGTFDFTEYYGSFLDYANTNISIYLPYYSVVQLPTSKVMNGQITVKAYIDYVSGSGRYFIKSQQVLKDFECIIGQYDFNIYNQVPFVASNNSVIGGQILGMCTSAVSGSVSGVLNSAVQMGTQNLDTMYGSIGTTSNVFTNTQPYIIIQRCNTVLPNNYNKNHGYLSNVTSSVTDLSGYTKINVTKVNGVPEWAESEIIKMLSNGVII